MKHLETIDPLWMLFVLGCMGAVAGFGALLRSDARLDVRALTSALLNSFFLSVIAAAFCFWQYGTESKWLTITVTLVAALGGNKAIMLALSVGEKWFKRIFGLNGDSHSNGDPKR